MSVRSIISMTSNVTRLINELVVVAVFFFFLSSCPIKMSRHFASCYNRVVWSTIV